MATPLADGSIIEVTWWQTYQSQQLLNTHHYRFSLAGGAPAFRPELLDFLGELNAAGAINAQMAGACSTAWTLQYVGAQAVYPTRLKTVYIEPAIAGTLGGTQAPANVAGVITKESDFATRWGIGSWHQGGLIASDVAGGVPSASLKGQLAQIGDELLLAITTASGASYSPLIWSRQVPSRITGLVAYQVQDTTRVMRRRTHRVGI